MKRIAVLCCVSLVQASLATAGETPRVSSTEATSAIHNPSPDALRKASLDRNPERLFRADSRSSSRPSADNQDNRNWMERHPVWTGAMIGFSAGFLLTYAVAANDHHQNEVFTPVGPGGPALVWGGVTAGIGALAGWGIGRNRDSNP